jgi:hypothetical protein
MQSTSKTSLIVSVCGLDAKSFLLVTRVHFAVRNAYRTLSSGIAHAGFSVYVATETNQVFAVLPLGLIPVLKRKTYVLIDYKPKVTTLLS